MAAPVIERRTKVYLPYQALRSLTDSTAGIIQHIPLPEKAFDVLEEVIVLAQSSRQYAITPSMVDDLITRKVGVPVGKIQTEEKDRLLNLEEIMHRRLVNQNRAVTALTRAMIRARAGVRSKSRPIGTFLFLGPTGVGKTEASKTLAQVYFGSDDYMVRLDMSEFQTPESMEVLVGGSRNPVGRLTSIIQDKPFTVLLLDEFEKAHKSVQQMFLQVLDEGRLTDARGQTSSFQHAIIIATSNAGAEFIRQNINKKDLPEDFDQQLREHILSKGLFSPELLNRFDGVITFTPLSQEHIRQVATLMLSKLNSRIDMEHGVTVAVTKEILDFLVANGYDPEFGARPMARLIQDTIEYAVAKMAISGQFQPGQQITLPPSQLQSLLD
jgi:ATP-dependent Clp protease ATP-binding subunit ClpC